MGRGNGTAHQIVEDAAVPDANDVVARRQGFRRLNEEGRGLGVDRELAGHACVEINR